VRAKLPAIGSAPTRPPRDLLLNAGTGSRSGVLSVRLAIGQGNNLFPAGPGFDHDRSKTLKLRGNPRDGQSAGFLF